MRQENAWKDIQPSSIRRDLAFIGSRNRFAYVRVYELRAIASPPARVQSR